MKYIFIAIIFCSVSISAQHLIRIKEAPKTFSFQSDELVNGTSNIASINNERIVSPHYLALSNLKFMNQVNNINYDLIINRDLTLNQAKFYILGRIESGAKKEGLDFNTNQEGNDEGDKTNYSSVYYFIGAAALAVIFYLVWVETDDEPQAKTFGYPVKP